MKASRQRAAEMFIVEIQACQATLQLACGIVPTC